VRIVSNLALKLKDELGEDPSQLGNAVWDLEQQKKVRKAKAP
jgi:hypothetical protein